MKRIRICYPTIFTPDADTGAYTVVVPDMEQINCGCVTEGDTFEQACQMALEAIGISLEETPEDQLPVPSRPETFELEPGEFVVPIWYDSLNYRKAIGSKSINKMVTIPEWMNEIVKEEHLNCSKILQEALKKKLDLE